MLVESNSSTKEKICNATNNENPPKRTLKCHWVARKSTKHRSKRRIGQLQKKSGMSANNGEIKAHTYTHSLTQAIHEKMRDADLASICCLVSPSKKEKHVTKWHFFRSDFRFHKSGGQDRQYLKRYWLDHDHGHSRSLVKGEGSQNTRTILMLVCVCVRLPALINLFKPPLGRE